MEYQQLPLTVKKVIKHSTNGEYALPLNAEFTCKFAGFLCLIPSLICLLMIVFAGQSSSLFFVFAAFSFSLVSFVLLGTQKRFVFDTVAKQLVLHSSTWSWRGKQRVVGNFTDIECVVSRLENSGDFLVKLAGQQYQLSQREDAFALVEFLANTFCLNCFETISEWPNKKPIYEVNVEYVNESSVEQVTEDNDLSSLGRSTPVIIKIWSMSALLKLSSPFWFFTLLTGLMQWWRQGNV